MVGNPLGVDWYVTIADVTYEIIDRDMWKYWVRM
jgi:hypothetical protein